MEEKRKKENHTQKEEKLVPKGCLSYVAASLTAAVALALVFHTPATATAPLLRFGGSRAWDTDNKSLLLGNGKRKSEKSK